MKPFRFLAAILSLSVLLAAVAAVHGQAEKVKERAKDLKKKVEGDQTSTNKPPAKSPPAPPQKPAK